MSLKFQLQENVPLEEVFQTLRCNTKGLTSEAAQQRLVIFGHNKLEEKKVILFVSILFLFLSVLSPWKIFPQ